MDGLLGKSDPFFTISRIDDPGSLAENNVKVYTSQVGTHTPKRSFARGSKPCQGLRSMCMHVLRSCACAGTYGFIQMHTITGDCGQPESAMAQAANPAAEAKQWGQSR